MLAPYTKTVSMLNLTYIDTYHAAAPEAGEVLAVAQATAQKYFPEDLLVALALFTVPVLISLILGCVDQYVMRLCYCVSETRIPEHKCTVPTFESTLLEPQEYIIRPCSEVTGTAIKFSDRTISWSALLGLNTLVADAILFGWYMEAASSSDIIFAPEAPILVILSASCIIASFAFCMDAEDDDDLCENADDGDYMCSCLKVDLVESDSNEAPCWGCLDMVALNHLKLLVASSFFLAGCFAKECMPSAMWYSIMNGSIILSFVGSELSVTGCAPLRMLLCLNGWIYTTHLLALAILPFYAGDSMLKDCDISLKIDSLCCPGVIISILSVLVLLSSVVSKFAMDIAGSGCCRRSAPAVPLPTVQV